MRIRWVMSGMSPDVFVSSGEFCVSVHGGQPSPRPRRGWGLEDWRRGGSCSCYACRVSAVSPLLATASVGGGGSIVAATRVIADGLSREVPRYSSSLCATWPLLSSNRY